MSILKDVQNRIIFIISDTYTHSDTCFNIMEQPLSTHIQSLYLTTRMLLLISTLDESTFTQSIKQV